VRIVNKSLRKDREERYQVVKDLWLDLKALKQELEFQDKLDRSVASEGDGTAVIAPAEATQTLSGPRPTASRSAISNISEQISIELKRHKAGAALALLAVLLIVGAGTFGVYKWFNRAEPVAHFWDVKLTRLTNSGNVIDATISPDGKYIVYALSDRSSQGLYIRQVSTANDKEIMPPGRVGVFGMTFSPDGTELYYAIKANLDAGTLYRIPVLGGTPVKVLEKIDGPISFSPDGKQFVLVRGNYPNTGESALVIANLDGSGQRDLVVKKTPERLSPIFFTGPSWSPDGKIIAASLGTLGGRSKVVGFSPDDGSEKVLSSESWPFAGRVQWLPDMSGLLVIAGDTVGSAQVWIVNYPDGRVRRVTNDLGTYRSIGLTHEGKTFTTVQAQGLVNVWVVPEGNAAKANRLPTGNIGFYSSSGNNLSWTPDGRIVFVSNEGGIADIWIADSDGSHRKQLTSNGAANFAPVVSADSRYIVFITVRDGKRNLWRMNLDGSNPLRLTSGLADANPSFSPDVRWVVYTASEGVKPALFKVPVDGGNPVQVSDHVASSGAVSPDGRLIAFTFPASSDPSAPPNRLGIIPFEGGSSLKTFEFAGSGTVLPVIQWSQDGKSIFYTVSTNNITNIWSQSLDGGPPKQITNFNDLFMTSFAWSRDGKQLACTRGALVRDALLVSDVK
jgi:TolB protein